MNCFRKIFLVDDLPYLKFFRILLGRGSPLWLPFWASTGACSYTKRQYSGLPHFFCKKARNDELCRGLTGFFILVVFFFLLSLPPSSFANPNQLLTKKNEIERELDRIQKQLVGQTETIRQKQEEIENIENEIEQLNFQANQKSKQLNTIADKLNEATDAMIDIVSVPQGAVLLNPNKNSIVTIEILSSITEQYTDLTEEFKKEVADIEEIKKIILVRKKKMEKELGELKEKQKILKTGLARRQQLYKEVNQDYKEAEKQAEIIKQKARDADELSSKLASITPRTKPQHRSYQSSSQKFGKGRLLLPVNGRITESFSSASQGIKISSRKNTSVVAPFRGKVLFASTFRDYGNTVIIEYNEAYHSVIAGLNNIDVVTGQYVLKGEPIGSIGKDKLYFELRQNSKPINPSGWFGKN